MRVRMKFHEIFSLTGGGWRETFGLWWAAIWRSLVMSFVFGFVAGFTGTLMGLDTEARNLFVFLSTIAAYLFTIRWLLKQEVVKYCPKNGYYWRPEKPVGAGGRQESRVMGKNFNELL